MGDAAGIGPEVTMKALGDAEMYAICRPVVIGDARILERANHVVHGALSINRISRPADGRFELGRVDCVDLDLLPADLPFGQISAVAGDAAFRYVKRAIELAQGPLPADTVFFRAGRGDFDAVVAMYHDQGHAPVKVLGLESGVNITVGLPIIRTSVDHGTAFDIAGKGVADPDSMKEAIRQAALLAPKRTT